VDPESEQLVDGEPVDAETPDCGQELPVVVEARVLERRTKPPARGGVPAVSTAVAAATGFVAGAATLALLRHYSGRASRELDSIGESVEQLRRPSRQTTTYVVQVRTIERHVE
jgi:hypothetical protein